MKKFSLILLIAIAFVSCKKNQLGGKSSVKGVVAHHGKAIGNAIVYIKFNSKESPGSDVSKYDAHVNADAFGEYKIPSLYKGEYFLYAVGEDPAVPPPYEVVGGLSVKLRTNEDVTLDIPVSED